MEWYNILMEKQYEIIDNFLPKEIFDSIALEATSSSFPWYYNSGTLPDQLDDPNSPFQFTHLVYRDHSPQSNFYQNLLPLINKIEAFSLLKIKMNLNVITKEQVKYGWHTDYPKENFNNFATVGRTAVYYLTDSDGPTVLKIDDQEVSVDCVANRFVWFNPSIVHTGTSPTNVKARVLINLNYIPR
jgi:hypothetical protein